MVAVAVLATTLCVIAADVLPVEVASPPYTARIVCEPTPEVENTNVADPLTNDAVPSTVLAPFLNVTVPVAVPPD